MPVSNALLSCAERERAIGDSAPDGSSERVERHRRPAVSVPVLSLHRMSMLPKFWIADRCLTITLCARHAHRALRERDGRDHRQELGRQPDGERDREQQRLERRADAAPRLTTRMKSTRKNDGRAG